MCATQQNQKKLQRLFEKHTVALTQLTLFYYWMKYNWWLDCASLLVYAAEVNWPIASLNAAPCSTACPLHVLNLPQRHHRRLPQQHWLSVVVAQTDGDPFNRGRRPKGVFIKVVTHHSLSGPESVCSFFLIFTLPPPHIPLTLPQLIINYLHFFKSSYETSHAQTLGGQVPL